MPAILDWLDTVKDIWTGFVVEVVLDEESMGKRSAQADVLKAAVDAVQPGYALQRIVVPSEPGIDPGAFTPEGWDSILKRWREGKYKDLMVLGSWPDDASDYVVVSLLLREMGLFRMEFSCRYMRQLSDDPTGAESLVDVVRLAWATCGGRSGWANFAIAAEPEQKEEVARLLAKWQRKSAVTLLDLTPEGRDPRAIEAFLPGACWLTLLSDASVATLGGVDALDAGLPQDLRLELFGDGGVLLQLTQTPNVPEDVAVEEKYRALRALLGPVLDTP